MPDWRSEIVRHLAPLRMDPAREESIAAELAEHLDQHYRDLLAEGVYEEIAQEKALSGLGDNELLRELQRLSRKEPAMVVHESAGGFWQGIRLDLRFALRALKKNPGFSVIAIATLALGIAANTVVFSLVNTVLLKPFPVREPDQIVMLWDRWPDVDRGPMSLDDFHDFQHQSHSFSQMAAWHVTYYNIVERSQPDHVLAARVSQGFFNLFGLQPVRGRLFTDSDHRQSAPSVALLGRQYWSSAFGSDPGIIGRVISLDDKPFTVVGIAPAEASLNRNPIAVWVPLEPNTPWKGRSTNYLEVFGRLARGVSLKPAQTDASDIVRRLALEFPAHAHGIVVDSMVHSMFGDAQPTLLVLLAAGCLLFLVSCANVANLVLARAISRRREFAVRASLGASRFRLARQLMTESGVLAGISGVAGTVVAAWAIHLLNRAWPHNMSRPTIFAVDARVLVFAIAASTAAALFFGLAPEVGSAGSSLSDCLKDGIRASGGYGHKRLRTILVIAEIATSTVLLFSSGLLLRSFWKVEHTDPGFRSDHVLTFGISLPATRYPKDAERSAFFRDLLVRVEHLPGVISVGGATELPMGTGSTTGGFEIEGRPPFKPDESPNIEKSVVTPSYFRAMGIAVLRGRGFGAQDSENAPKAVVINEELARLYWPNQDPLGKRIDLEWGNEGDWQQIVGVIANLRYGALDKAVVPAAYVVSTQYPVSGLEVAVHSSIPPEELVSEIRGQVKQMDSMLPVANIITLHDIIGESMSSRRSSTALVSLFALLTAVLTGTGLFGVISYSVAQRTREIGIRMALGAALADIRIMILTEGLALIGLGLAVAAPVAFAGSRLLSGLLFGVHAYDAYTIVLAISFVALVGILATYLPANRATRVAPVQALRSE